MDGNRSQPEFSNRQAGSIEPAWKADRRRFLGWAGWLAWTSFLPVNAREQATQAGNGSRKDQKLTLEWERNFLSIQGLFPGQQIRINYIEAYCRPGSSDRDWQETVIKHESRLVSQNEFGTALELEDRLSDGVVVMHSIYALEDEVVFELIAHNPTQIPSFAYWAQPCIRVDRFTGSPTDDARALIPRFARQCFVFIDGNLTRLPTSPWAEKARYTPGQVYCPSHVDRDDVNPRPLSRLVPSNGLCGCFSEDNKYVLAVAWEPYQELFQGVAGCIHSDFRIGGLGPQETKVIRGKLYIVPADIAALLKRYESDFPEQISKRAGL